MLLRTLLISNVYRNSYWVAKIWTLKRENDRYLNFIVESSILRSKWKRERNEGRTYWVNVVPLLNE